MEVIDLGAQSRLIDELSFRIVSGSGDYFEALYIAANILRNIKEQDYWSRSDG